MIVFILYVKKPRHGEYRAQSRGQPVGGRLHVQALGRARAPAPPSQAVRLCDMASLACWLCCHLLHCEPSSVLGDSRIASCGLPRPVV